MARRITKPINVLAKEIEHLKDIKRHMDAVKKDRLVVKGQEAVTLMRLGKQRERIYKLIEEMSEFN